METKQVVLQYLALHPREWISSAILVSSLAVSRTAVWKAIKQLQETGYQIDSQAGKGYLYTPNQTLSKTIIKQAIGSQWQLEVYDQISSTNSRAKELAAQKPIRPTIVVSNEQTAGYGRFGREYFSPSQTGIYLSFLLPTDNQSVDPGQLTTGVAVAVAQALETQYAVSVKIKWVNDLIVDDHKVAGILSEAIADVETGHLTSVIVGIGINLVVNAGLPETLQQKAGALINDSAQSVDRNQTVINVINSVKQLLENDDSCQYMKDYRQRSIVINQSVSVKMGNQLIDGVVTNVDDHGALVLQTKTGSQVVGAGEITKLNLKSGGYHG